MRFPIILALAAAGPAFAQPAYAQSVEPPRISVVGTGAVKTAPDRATIEYGVRGEGTTSDAAVGALVARRKQIEAGIDTFGAAVELRTGRVSVSEARGKDCSDEDTRLSVGECSIRGYVAELPFTLKTAQIAKAGTLVSLIGRLEGNSPHISEYTLTDPKLAQRRAIAAALADAREKADAIAEGTSRHLGRVLAASHGNMNADNGNDILVTAARRVASPAMVMPPIAVDLHPQPIETQAQVTVMYEIAP